MKIYRGATRLRQPIPQLRTYCDSLSHFGRSSPDRVDKRSTHVWQGRAKSDNSQTRIIRRRVLWKHIKLEVVAAIIAAAHHAESDSGVRRKPTWLIAMSL